jgi:hypothetical protein
LISHKFSGNAAGFRSHYGFISIVRFFIPDQSPARAATRIITYAIGGCPKILRRKFLHLILVAVQNSRRRPFRTGTSRELTCRQVDRLHRLERRKGHPRSSAAPFRAATYADYSTCVPFRFLGFWPGAHEDAFLCTRGALAFSSQHKLLHIDLTVARRKVNAVDKIRESCSMGTIKTE